MTTACLTIVEENSEEKAVLYREFDGYPIGNGQDLKDYLDDFAFDAPGLSAHRIVAQLENCHQLLDSMEAKNLESQYIYTISIRDGYLNLKVQGISFLYPELPDEAGMATLYDGDLRDFDPYLADSNWYNQ